MKFTVYVYDSDTGCKSKRFVEAVNEEEAIKVAVNSFCKDYNISYKLSIWRRYSLKCTTNPEQAYWL